MPINLSQFITGEVANATSLNVVFSSAVSSGNLIVAHSAAWGTLANHHFSNIVDNVNANAYTVGCLSTMVSDTNTQLVLAYKLNISSGAAASTYRVSLNSSGAAGNRSLCVCEYSGGPFAVGSTGSSNGTSSSPRGPQLTASSTPFLCVTSATENSTTLFNSTVSAPGHWITTIDTTNSSSQILIVGDSTSGLPTQQPTFGMAASTRWVANVIVFTGAGAGGGATFFVPPTFSLMGVQ